MKRKKQKSYTNGMKEAGHAFYKTVIAKKSSWQNAYDNFSDGFQEAIIMGTKLHTRILNAFDKIKATKDLDVFDGYCTDGAIKFGKFSYEKYPLEKIEMAGMPPMNFGGMEDYEYIKMVTQSLDFYIVIKRATYKYGKKEKLIAVDFTITKFKHGAKFNPSLLLASFNHDGVEKVTGFTYKAYDKTLEVENHSFVSWQYFCWWINYFEALEYQLTNPDL